MRLTISIAAIATLSLAAPLAAAEVVPVSGFRSVELRGGGEVVLHHGPSQRVTILEGSSQVTRMAIAPESNGRLVIEACERRCPSDYRLRIEIVSPRFDGIGVAGGGSIRAESNFPGQNSIGLSVRGGGSIDARSIRAASVGASVTGGGSINTHPLRSLGASVTGGGLVRYWGNPSVGSNIRGGGSVTRAGS